MLAVGIIGTIGGIGGPDGIPLTPSGAAAVAGLNIIGGGGTPEVVAGIAGWK